MISKYFVRLLLVTVFVASQVPAFTLHPSVSKSCSRALQRQPVFEQHSRKSATFLFMSEKEDSSTALSRSLPFWLDPGTKGGAIFLSLVLFVVPIIGYAILTSLFGLDPIDTGKWIGVGFTVIVTFLWVGTYIFRVATKDMTYAKQLKDYENAVIAKRLEELDEDEIQALVEEIERDDF